MARSTTPGLKDGRSVRGLTRSKIGTNNENLKTLPLQKFVPRRESIAGVFHLGSNLLGRSGVATKKTVFGKIDDRDLVRDACWIQDRRLAPHHQREPTVRW